MTWRGVAKKVYPWLIAAAAIVTLFGGIGWIEYKLNPPWHCTKWEDRGDVRCTGYMPGHIGGYSDVVCKHVLTCVASEYDK